MRAVLKETTLLGAMFAVTVAVVTCETGHVSSGLAVGAFAAPLKWLVATAHHRLFDAIERRAASRRAADRVRLDALYVKNRDAWRAAVVQRYRMRAA